MKIIIIAILLSGSGFAFLRAQGDYHLTVLEGGHQTFHRFGASQTNDAMIPLWARRKMTRLVYKEPCADVLRLWLGTGSGVSVDQMKEGF